MKPLTLRSVLVATDLETDMVPALRSACELADLAGAELHVIHAGAAPARREETDAKVAQFIAAMGRQLSVTVQAAPPTAAIAQEARYREADVIVLAQHRRDDGPLGSTADRVVRNARVPCLILPVPLTVPLASVLVPVDLRYVAGPLSVAMTWASALRQRPKRKDDPLTSVTVLHVTTDPSADERTLDARLCDEVTTIEERFAHLALVDIEHHVERSDDIPATIWRAANTENATLIVLGTRAERIEADPLGSVSSAITRLATRPVLLVPPEVWSQSSEAEG